MRDTLRRIANWVLSSLIRKSARLNTFVGIAAVGTSLIFGSFLWVTLQALWQNFANVLMPIMVMIIVGYSTLLIHMLIEIRRSISSRDALGTFFAFFEFLLLVVTTFALFSTGVRGFFGRAVNIGLGEGILPLEARIVATVALLLPFSFLLISGLSFLVISVSSSVRLEVFRTFEPVSVTQAVTVSPSRGEPHVRLVGDDYVVNRSSHERTKSLSGEAVLYFKNDGETPTTMFPIEWSNFFDPKLRITLELPRQPTYDIEPNRVVTLRPRISIDSPVGIVKAIEGLGGSIPFQITHRFSSQSGEKRQSGEFKVKLE
jgi:hypothetical protein